MQENHHHHHHVFFVLAPCSPYFIFTALNLLTVCCLTQTESCYNQEQRWKRKVRRRWRGVINHRWVTAALTVEKYIIRTRFWTIYLVCATGVCVLCWFTLFMAHSICRSCYVRHKHVDGHRSQCSLWDSDVISWRKWGFYWQWCEVHFVSIDLQVSVSAPSFFTPEKKNHS